jgi:Icc-related predicted phosphoesterase
MRIQLLSDLHFEHQADVGRSFVASLNPDVCDVLVLAGDICTVEAGLLNAITLFCQRFQQVVLVPGNHEFYGTTRGRVNATLQKARRRNPNLHLLQRDVVEIGGKRFLGTPLWFPPTPTAKLNEAVWSDFSCIQGFAKWVYQENAMDMEFFRRELREGDIVVTHYLPSFQSVHPRYAGEPNNCYFVCSLLDELIEDRKPAVWMHGHTHESADYMIGSTRIVCNPFGYADLGMLNGPFQDEKIIDVL